MRVLLIDVNCKTSSTGQIVYNLYSCLNSDGHEAAVCYGRGDKILESNIYKFGLDWETYLHAFLTRITGYTGCFSYFSTKRLIKFIDMFKPEVVHIHELHAYFVNIKSLLNYLAMKKIKVVHTLHCEFSYTGKCGHSVECEKWKTECGDCPHLQDYPATLWCDHTKKMQETKKMAFAGIQDLTIVTPSEWLANRVKQSFFSNREIRRISNGIDVGIFRPVNTTKLRNELKIGEEKIVLALAPNLLSKEKGGEFVLEVAHKLKDEKIKFVLVGVDNSQESNEGNVIIKGRITNKEVLAQYYSMADLFVICSERENLPTTCLEAQCCGTPICGFATGGIRETTSKEYSHLVEYGDVEGLKYAIQEMLQRRFDRQEISQHGIKKYSIREMYLSYLNLYEKGRN